MFVGILLGLFGTGWAVEEQGGHALLAILFLPPALLLYTPIVAIAATAPIVRLAMACAGIAVVGMALASTVSRMRLTEARPVHRHSPARL